MDRSEWLGAAKMATRKRVNDLCGKYREVGLVIDIARLASPGYRTILLLPKFTPQTSNPSLAASKLARNGDGLPCT
ncbi:hypothetical protein GCM10008956_31710 [Deinococcus arenae]|uniref:Uncharacterized protein n=1 Tax=Deinococcus arenae TaxID=1452751 RepID=A0A8H9L9W6_9DEIO|nr:hypothetical protein GCM10008956_31710 [Deinococcus arenae]